MANYSGLFNGVHSEDYALLNGRSPNRYHLMRLMRKRNMAEYREVLTTLLEDSTPASTASRTYSRVQATANAAANVQGGARTIETVELLGATLDSTDIDEAGAGASGGRAVIPGDVTKIQEELASDGDRILRAPSNGSGTITYPDDASGNGGGGKLD